MSWFFGRRSDDDDDDEDEYSSEEYTSSEDEDDHGDDGEEEEFSDDDHSNDGDEDGKPTSGGGLSSPPADSSAEEPLVKRPESSNEPVAEVQENKPPEKQEENEIENDVVEMEDQDGAIPVDTNTTSPPEDDRQDSSFGPEKQIIIEREVATVTKTEESARDISEETKVPQDGTKEAETESEKTSEDQPSQTPPERTDPSVADNTDLNKEEEVTSTHEKRSLLVLAAEHDRVDIMKAILSDECKDKEELLNSSIPPLHIAIAYGSTNAVQCLLRMGADPSVRPDIKKIQAEVGENEQLVDIPNMGRFDGQSAWELAFGMPDEDEDVKPKKRSSWFGGGDNTRKQLDIAPSKLEGIRHAFTAEALRCIGSDEVGRLIQLRDSGMPSSIDIGGKNLFDWSVEMDAVKCEEALRSSGENGADEAKGSVDQNKDQAEVSAVLDRSRPGTETISQLSNRIDELESLAKALSTCLDNLAEEVSVCHGLLLMGGGASALASHVRSLKTLKENKLAELERLEEAWEHSEDELAYWVKQCGEKGKEIAELMSPALIPDNGNESATHFSGSPEEELAQKHQLKAQAAVLENKVRKLRASITDLSEENTRDLEEVEKRGLSGGIKLVRTLRDELREVEFTLTETRSAEALCRAKIKWIQAKMGPKYKVEDERSVATSVLENGITSTVADKTASQPEGQSDQESGENCGIEKPQPEQVPEEKAPCPTPSPEPTPERGVKSTPHTKTIPSEAIANGQSTAIALKREGTSGYFTVDLWKILLRIIGLGANSPRSTKANSSADSTSSANVMIV